MNPESPANRRKALEESLTALILGELPPDHAAALQEVLKHDPELARTHERLKQVIALIQEAVTAPPTATTAPPAELKLSPERRATLLRSFKTVTPLPFAELRREQRSTWLVPVGIAAVLLATFAALLTPSVSKSKRWAQGSAASAPSPSADATRDEMAATKLAYRAEPPASPAPSFGLASSGGRVDNSTGLPANDKQTTIVLPSGSEDLERFKLAPSPAAGGIAAARESKAEEKLGEAFRRRYGGPGPSTHSATEGPSRAVEVNPENRSSHVTHFGKAPPSQEMLSELARSDLKWREDLADTFSRSLARVPAAPEVALRTEAVPPPQGQTAANFLADIPVLGGGLASAQGGAGGGAHFYSLNAAGYAALPATNSWTVGAAQFYSDDKVGRELTEQPAQRLSKDLAGLEVQREQKVEHLAFGDADKKLRELATVPQIAKGTDAAKNEAEALHEAVELARDVKELAGKPAVAAVQVQPVEKPADAPLAKPASPPPVPQPEVATRENAFSTFSLNVSDVSFKLAAASLEKGVLPEPAAIRSEEFINAFDYRDPEARPGVPVTFAWERAQYPFAQNRDLLRFSVKTAAQGRQAGRPLNLVLLLDNSGSMERADRVAIIREALRVLAAQLRPQDMLSVVTFARTAQLRVDGISGAEAGRVAEELGNLTPQGGTNLGEALNLAYQAALKHYLAGGINRVVLLTDGAANLGEVDPDALRAKVEAHRKQGIALDGFGIGWEGYNDDLLEVLTRHGDGRYGFLNTPEEAAERFAGQLAGALRVAAANVKVQVEFNPARVGAYRQIGYARHQLAKEQFRDNTVDAAEIGAAESGNALYVVAPLASGSGPLATVRVRYQVPGTHEYREQEWTVPYEGAAPALDQAGPAMRLAATAGTFAEWLAASPFVAEVSSDRLLACLRGVPEVYGADPRPHKLEWMIRQTKSLSGQ